MQLVHKVEELLIQDADRSDDNIMVTMCTDGIKGAWRDAFDSSAKSSAGLGDICEGIGVCGITFIASKYAAIERIIRHQNRADWKVCLREQLSAKFQMAQLL